MGHIVEMLTIWTATWVGTGFTDLKLDLTKNVRFKRFVLNLDVSFMKARNCVTSRLKQRSLSVLNNQKFKPNTFPESRIINANVEGLKTATSRQVCAYRQVETVRRLLCSALPTSTRTCFLSLRPFR